jgi:hypothetical protein
MYFISTPDMGMASYIAPSLADALEEQFEAHDS